MPRRMLLLRMHPCPLLLLHLMHPRTLLPPLRSLQRARVGISSFSICLREGLRFANLHFSRTKILNIGSRFPSITFSLTLITLLIYLLRPPPPPPLRLPVAGGSRQYHTHCVRYAHCHLPPRLSCPLTVAVYLHAARTRTTDDAPPAEYLQYSRCTTSLTHKQLSRNPTGTCTDLDTDTDTGTQTHAHTHTTRRCRPTQVLCTVSIIPGKPMIQQEQQLRKHNQRRR